MAFLTGFWIGTIAFSTFLDVINMIKYKRKGLDIGIKRNLDNNKLFYLIPLFNVVFVINKINIVNLMYKSPVRRITFINEEADVSTIEYEIIDDKIHVLNSTGELKEKGIIEKTALVRNTLEKRKNEEKHEFTYILMKYLKIQNGELIDYYKLIEYQDDFLDNYENVYFYQFCSSYIDVETVNKEILKLHTFEELVEYISSDVFWGFSEPCFIGIPFEKNEKGQVISLKIAYDNVVYIEPSMDYKIIENNTFTKKRKKY